MDEITDFFQNIFDTSSWPPRWKCGYWSNFHGGLYIVSELLIWIAYFLIPLIIINYILRKKAALKFNRAYIYFAAFILLCGSTHFLDAMMFWIPMYRLNALLRLATALVSLATVYHLIKILPEAFKQRTSLELEREVQRRVEAEQKLAEANKNLEAFAYVASHDLQEPVRKINAFSSLLIEKNKQHFDRESQELADKIVNASGRMRKMVEDVLMLSAISNDIDFTKVNLRDSINNVLDDLELKIREKDAIINIGELPGVQGNGGQLYQLFLNLIGNALKFSETRPSITITSERSGQMAFVHVKDNGIGMDEEDRDKIFEPFKRLHSQSKYEGSGIGLAICKRIVDIHKGTIEVKSKPGEGTEFVIGLPLAP